MKREVKETIELQVAMDNLASIANIDLESPPPIGIVGKRLITSEEEFAHDTVQWLQGEGVDPIVELLDLTYRSIHQHLIKIFENPETKWESRKTQKGIAAMMDLIGESAPKMDRFFEIRFGKKSEELVSEREEFKALQKFYSDSFVKKFPSGIEGEEAWKEEALDLPDSELKDFESIKNDLDYELFYIHNEEGKPYFNHELLRNIKLTCDFDLEAEDFEEDPLLKVRAMQDRDLHATAGQILESCHPVLVDYYKIARKLEGNELSQSLGMALIALFVAANPRYLLQNTAGKSSLQYFDDFFRYLRRAMRTSEYQKLIAYPPDSTDRASHLLLYLVHSLAKSLFVRMGGVRAEAVGLIHRAARKGSEIKQKGKEPLLRGETIWNQLSIDDELFRTFLSKFPNGPIFKVLDLIRETEDAEAIIPFDPIAQGNLPSHLFEVYRKGKKIDILRLASPTRQSVIHKVEIADEFRGFLRSLSQDSFKQKHLLINFQDRTAWKEYARAKALESLQLSSEFNQHLVVISLPKVTDFYHQVQEYAHLNRAEDFLRVLAEQVLETEGAGYFLPPQLKTTDMTRFIELVIPAIHKLFFHGKNTLTRRHREDFIEIFYQFFILKCLDVIDPTSMSFTCKDAIDTGAASGALFFGFIELLSGNFSSQESLDFFKWLLYTPALFIRERAVNPERLNRTLSALELIDGALQENRSAILETFGSLYHAKVLSTLNAKF
jgi:hypothetical protein